MVHSQQDVDFLLAYLSKRLKLMLFFENEMPIDIYYKTMYMKSCIINITGKAV